MFRFIERALSGLEFYIVKMITEASLTMQMNMAQLPPYGAQVYGEFPAAARVNRAFYNLGAGNWRHDLWQNVDCASDYYANDLSLIDIPWDVTEGQPMPVPSGSAELCYSSHAVEHLLNGHVDHLFAEAARIIKPDGVFRVTAPDIHLYFEAWKRRDIFFNYHYGFDYPFGGYLSTFHSEPHVDLAC